MAKANYANLPINHDETPIRLFKSDFLEFFTHIHPVAVLVLFLPVAVFFMASALAHGGTVAPVHGSNHVKRYHLAVSVSTLSEFVPSFGPLKVKAAKH